MRSSVDAMAGWRDADMRRSCAASSMICFLLFSCEVPRPRESEFRVLQCLQVCKQASSKQLFLRGSSSGAECHSANGHTSEDLVVWQVGELRAANVSQFVGAHNFAHKSFRLSYLSAGNSSRSTHSQPNATRKEIAGDTIFSRTGDTCQQPPIRPRLRSISRNLFIRNSRACSPPQL
jgi:hypothetical protein